MVKMSDKSVSVLGDEMWGVGVETNQCQWDTQEMEQVTTEEYIIGVMLAHVVGVERGRGGQTIERMSYHICTYVVIVVPADTGCGGFLITEGR